MVGFELVDAFERAAELYGTCEAVRCGRERLTFAEVRRRVHAVAMGLHRLGLRPGDRIALLGPNCHRVIELYWVVVLAGTVLVPLEVRLGDAEMAQQLRDSGPRALVGGSPEACERLERLYPGAPVRIRLADGPATWLPYEELVGGSGDVVGHATGEDRPFVLFYTAAVDGRARGSMITPRNLLAQVVQTGEGLGIGEGDAYGNFLPLSHTFGAYLMLVSFCRGARNVVVPAFEAVAAARAIRDEGVTFFAEFAPMGERVLQAAAQEGIPLRPSLRFVVGIDRTAVIRRFTSAGIRWFNLYGQTETAGLVLAGEVPPEGDCDAFVGRPLPMVRVALRRPDGSPAAMGEPGELWVRSGSVVRRYWPDEPTRLQDGWLRTGDLLRRDGDGNYWYVGRTHDKYLIKTGGLNVYPAEVEQVLLSHPDVAQACVFGAPDPEYRERVCAAVVPRPGRQLDPEALRAFCAERIASYKCPKVIFVVERLPTGPAGVDREAVRRSFVKG